MEGDGDQHGRRAAGSLWRLLLRRLPPTQQLLSWLDQLRSCCTQTQVLKLEPPSALHPSSPSLCVISSFFFFFSSVWLSVTTHHHFLLRSDPFGSASSLLLFVCYFFSASFPSVLPLFLLRVSLSREREREVDEREVDWRLGYCYCMWQPMPMEIFLEGRGGEAVSQGRG